MELFVTRIKSTTWTSLPKLDKEFLFCLFDHKHFNRHIGGHKFKPKPIQECLFQAFRIGTPRFFSPMLKYCVMPVCPEHELFASSLLLRSTSAHRRFEARSCSRRNAARAHCGRCLRAMPSPHPTVARVVPRLQARFIQSRLHICLLFAL